MVEFVPGVVRRRVSADQAIARRAVRRRPDPAVVGAAGGPLPADLSGQLGRAVGSPLHPAVRAEMEGAFGADLSAVRIHRNSAVAPRIQAHAFTVGNDIHVAPGAPALESAEGKHTLAHELAHVVQQGGGVGRIRRKIGFEFEEGNWRPWKLDRGTNWGTAAAPLPIADNTPNGLARTEEQLDARPPVTPVARKKKIHVGTNFRLEGDDTPGPTASNVEFVTVPFTEDVPGIQALTVALNEMCAIVDALANHTGAKGPDGAIGRAAQRIKAGPPWPYDPFAYVTEKAHGLSGSADVHRSNLLLSGGHRAGMFKMQATSGVTLADVPELLSTYGTPAVEDPARTARLTPARELHRTGPAAADIAGQAPAMALAAMRRMVNSGHLPADEARALTDRSILRAGQGYLAVVFMYLKGMQIPSGIEGAKARVMFLLRNKFSDLYATLDPAVQRLFALQNGDLLCQEVLAVSNANPLVVTDTETLDDALAPNQPLINFTYGRATNVIGQPVPRKENPHQKVVSAFTIRHWLRSVAVGQDHLTQAGMATWLQVNAGVGAVQAKESADWVLESFGEYGLDTTSGPDPLALFENRGILPVAHRTVIGSGGPMRDVAKIAYNYLIYEAARKIGHGTTTYPTQILPGPG